MIGESIPRQMRQDVRTIVKKHSDIRHINNMRSMYIGNNKFILLISVDVENSSKGSTIESIIEQVKNDITRKYSNAKYIYIDVEDSGS
jgi:divalent metal cation (Fe/Co/Zn/Cd) transporter